MPYYRVIHLENPGITCRASVANCVALQLSRHALDAANYYNSLRSRTEGHLAVLEVSDEGVADDILVGVWSVFELQKSGQTQLVSETKAHAWDLVRLYQVCQSDQRREEIAELCKRTRQSLSVDVHWPERQQCMRVDSVRDLQRLKQFSQDLLNGLLPQVGVRPSQIAKAERLYKRFANYVEHALGAP